MSAEALAAAPAVLAEAQVTRVGYGASMADAMAFQGAMHRAAAAAEAPSPTAAAMARSLDGIDASVRVLAERAQTALERGAAVQPSELVLMSVKCYEFLFHCQLASNVANRTSDGLQQLFRQQS